MLDNWQIGTTLRMVEDGALEADEYGGVTYPSWCRLVCWWMSNRLHALIGR